MLDTPPHKKPSPTNDRFSLYDQRWHHTFKDCYLAWLKSEKVPIRRFLFSTLMSAFAAIGAAAFKEASPIVYTSICFLTLVVVGVAVYLHHLEKG